MRFRLQQCIQILTVVMACELLNSCSASPSQKLAESSVKFGHNDPFLLKNKSSMNTPSAIPYEYLFVKNSEFQWRGDLFIVKEFVKDQLNLTGWWTLPSRNVKQFLCELYQHNIIRERRFGRSWEKILKLLSSG